MEFSNTSQYKNITLADFKVKITCLCNKLQKTPNLITDVAMSELNPKLDNDFHLK